MANINELLNGHVTLEVECIDRLYLNGYVGKLATSGGLYLFMGSIWASLCRHRSYWDRSRSGSSKS